MGVISIIDADTRTDTGTSTEARIRAGALTCIARWGLTKTTLDDVARESGVSRATIYRLFPGGKDTVFDAVLGQEVHRFFALLAVELDRHDDPAALLVAGVGGALRFLHEHAALHSVLENEPGLLLSRIAFHRLGPLLDAAAAFAVPFLIPHVPAGVEDPDTAAIEVAELLVRVVLDHALRPSPHLDPADEASLTRFVRTHLLPALLATPDPRPDPQIHRKARP